MRPNPLCPSQLGKTLPCGVILSLWLSLVAIGLAAAASPGPPVRMAEVERAVLAENWKEVLRLLDGVDSRTPDPVLRLIKGHACLALNDNNRSYRLFLSVGGSVDLETYQQWVDGLLREHPGHAMTYYLLGDAKARSGRFVEAISAFDKGDRLAPDNPLILNSRGIAHAAANHFDEALSDVERAAGSSVPLLADACANLGFLAIHQKEGAREARQGFRQGDQVLAGFFIRCSTAGGAFVSSWVSGLTK